MVFILIRNDACVTEVFLSLVRDVILFHSWMDLTEIILSCIFIEVRIDHLLVEELD